MSAASTRSGHPGASAGFGDHGRLSDRAVTAPGGSSVLRLAPRADAAAQARHWVARSLDGWPTSAIETAQLLVSEVVTNAVLHARTEIEVRLTSSGEWARLEVADGVVEGPLPKHFELDAETGRGLKLVASLALEWGVRRSSEGKVVWFILGPTSGGGRTAGLAVARVTVDLGAGPTRVCLLPGTTRRPSGQSLAEPTAQTDGRPGARVDTDGATGREGRRFEVRVLGLPLGVYLEAEQQNDAVLRELGLIMGSTERDEHDVPRRLLELAEELQAKSWQGTEDIRAQVEGAVERGRSMVDLALTLPASGWDELVELTDRLEEVDRYCEEGWLLTMPSSPLVRQFRRWSVQQVADQLGGKPPRAWSHGHP